MSKAHWQLIAALLGLAVLLAAGWLLRPARLTSHLKVGCPQLESACVLPAGLGTVQTNRAPSALKPFRLIVKQSAATPLTARFGMVGMEMGPIAFPLQPQADGSLAADVMLPFCVQGRRDWLMWLEGGAATVEVAFSAEK